MGCFCVVFLSSTFQTLLSVALHLSGSFLCRLHLIQQLTKYDAKTNYFKKLILTNLQTTIINDNAQLIKKLNTVYLGLFVYLLLIL